jgi:ADP-ribose pyrophosphatase YjhB (NUDIX family)
MSERIRTLAVVVCRRRDAIVVEHGEDRLTGARFYRAIGGGVEFGERAVDAARREWREELSLALDSLRLLGVLENVFTYEGRPGHEVVFAFEATIVEAWPYEREGFTVVDGDGLRHEVSWVTRDDLRRDESPLYPTGLAELAWPGD